VKARRLLDAVAAAARDARPVHEVPAAPVARAEAHLEEADAPVPVAPLTADAGLKHEAERTGVRHWCRLGLTLVADEGRIWQPISRERFGDLRRGQRVQDRRGRVWTVVSELYFEDGRDRINLRSGDPVRREKQRYGDDYMLLGEES
jgi:hypothetical protein